MGGSSYSVHSFHAAAKAAGGTAKMFRHSAAASASGSTTVHDTLDPKKLNKAGRLVRESRDSDAHQDTVAVVIGLDGTGSMANTPKVFVERLPGLMSTLVKEGWLKDPQICFAQVCDHQDANPLQLGQFESGNELDGALTNMLLLGGGAGPKESHEAYNLLLYMMGHHSEIDCFEKRGKKGYFFIIADERPYPTLTKQQIKDTFGIDAPQDYSFDELLAKAREKYSVHWITPSGTFHWDDSFVVDYIREKFGENYHRLEDPAAICAFISGIIAVEEGYDLDDVSGKLKEVDSNASSVASATRSLSVYAAKGTIAKQGKSSSSEELAESAKGADRF